MQSLFSGVRRSRSKCWVAFASCCLQDLPVAWDLTAEKASCQRLHCSREHFYLLVTVHVTFSAAEQLRYGLKIL